MTTMDLLNVFVAGVILVGFGLLMMWDRREWKKDKRRESEEQGE